MGRPGKRGTNPHQRVLSSSLGSRVVSGSDGSSSSLRRCSSVIHVHQNELVQLVQLFNFSQKMERNG